MNSGISIAATLLIAMCMQALGQESVQREPATKQFAKEEIIYPHRRPVFGGTSQETFPDEKIIVYVYKFDITGDGKKDLFTSSNALKNGNAGGYVWRLFIQKSNGLYEWARKPIEFHTRRFFVRHLESGRVDLHYFNGHQGKYHRGVITAEDGKVNDYKATETEYDLENDPFYQFYNNFDYKPKLMKMPYLEAKKKRAEFEEKKQSEISKTEENDAQK